MERVGPGRDRGWAVDAWGEVCFRQRGQEWLTESCVSLPSCVFLATLSDRSYLLVLLCCHGTKILPQRERWKRF